MDSGDTSGDLVVVVFVLSIGTMFMASGSSLVIFNLLIPKIAFLMAVRPIFMHISFFDFVSPHSMMPEWHHAVLDYTQYLNSLIITYFGVLFARPAFKSIDGIWTTR